MSIAIKDKIVGNAATDLDQAITGIQWGKGYGFGKGINAVTGGLSGNALQPFTPKPQTVKSSEEHYRFIQNESDLDREIEASASGKYNIAGAEVTASTEYLSTIKFSELSVTLIAKYKSQYAGYDEGGNYQLTEQAKKLIGNPQEFRRVYGDYFIAGAQRGSLFIAVYVCQATSVESMDKFKAAFKGEAPEIFSAEGSTSFMQAASQNNINLSFDLTMIGYKGTSPIGPWNPEKINEALDWFKQNEKGTYLEALLQHYSTIDTSYPRIIDIAPSVFIDLHLLYTDYWDIIALYGSCPKYYQNQYSKNYQELISSVQANESALATDADLRIQLQEKANYLLALLGAVNARQDFYFKVKNAIGNEPKEGIGTAETGGVHSWLYGYNTYPLSSDVVISSSDMKVARIGTGAGYWEYTFQFGPDNKYLVVGWEVIAYWTDGTDGEWWKSVPQILLTSQAAVHVKSRWGRGFDWGLRVYYVDAKDYQFEPSSNEGDSPTEGDVRITRITASEGIKGLDYATAAEGVYRQNAGLEQVSMSNPHILRTLTEGKRYDIIADQFNKSKSLIYNGDIDGTLWFVSK
ncbi:hypothetical protein KSF_081110 [Reticulibacter mediterranei]|uniref:MACPF domain-containing protein n=1 Tax=Reticulibacter mediterranei TaxID=2778369 RepID=A0A8J3N6Y8_9CHLR|nr:hypothetical protein [Reticulibacter mediterranei]GHO98063.1 hypothetical protein KSF_081110 [Reticulibacter mediterranei]